MTTPHQVGANTGAENRPNAKLNNEVDSKLAAKLTKHLVNLHARATAFEERLKELKDPAAGYPPASLEAAIARVSGVYEDLVIASKRNWNWCWN